MFLMRSKDDEKETRVEPVKYNTMDTSTRNIVSKEAINIAFKGSHNGIPH